MVHRMTPKTTVVDHAKCRRNQNQLRVERQTNQEQVHEDPGRKVRILAYTDKHNLTEASRACTVKIHTSITGWEKKRKGNENLTKQNANLQRNVSSSPCFFSFSSGPAHTLAWP